MEMEKLLLPSRRLQPLEAGAQIKCKEILWIATKWGQPLLSLYVGFSEYGAADIRLRLVQYTASYNENPDTIIEYTVYL